MIACACEKCRKPINPRSHAKHCSSCAAKARWARPEFKAKCRKALTAAWIRPDVREKRSRSIAIAMNRPETNAKLHRPHSELAKLHGRIAQNAPHLRALHSRLSSGENNYFFGKPGTNRGKFGKDHPMFGYRHSTATKQKYSAQRTREKNSQWRGGIRLDPHGPEFNAKLKNHIRARDNFRCRLCEKREGGKQHHVHHIDYEKKNNRPDNLITLCIPCHAKTTTRDRDKWPALLSGILDE